MADEQAVFRSLGELNAEQLEQVCDLLKIKTDGIKGNKSKLTKSIYKILSSDELEASEDGGASIFAAVMQRIHFFQAVKMELPTDNFEGEEGQFSQEKLQTPKFMASHQLDDEEKMKEIFMKQFKISGKIGKPGVKDSLTYSSLIFQIDSGLKKGYSERNIVDAVVKAISSAEAPLREYLEGKGDLTLKILCENLRFFYQEKDATSLFTSLSTAKQNNDESPQDFVMRLINLRQKVLFVARQEKSNYDFELVQKRFLHAISTGIKNDNIRGELRPFLKGRDVTDEKLLARLQLAVQDEGERSEKFCTTAAKKAQVNLVEEPTDDQSKKKFVLSAEIDMIKTQLNEVTNFVRQNMQPSPAATHHQKRNQNRAANGSMGRVCHDCEKNKVKVCEHCFFCGSEEHLLAGCKERFKIKKIGKN